MQVTADTASVSFDAVSFAYVPGRDILNNLSFSVKPGQKVAIVGSSGSGYDFLSEPCFVSLNSLLHLHICCCLFVLFTVVCLFAC